MAGRFASWIGRLVLPRRRRGFLRDERGVTAIEFGLLALPFFAIVGAILETSIVFLSSQILDSAVQDSSRLIRTGQSKAFTIESFRANVCSRLYGLFGDCSGLFVKVNVVTDFKSATVVSPVDYTCKTNCGWATTESYATGGGSAIVLVQVYYKWPTVLNIGNLGLANLADGKRLLGSATVFQNEPFT